jgi:ribulose-phosphate 3-epimerase
MIEINPTCVPTDAESVAKCAENFKAFASRMQVDIDDGVFAPHLTWPYATPGRFDPFRFPSLPTMALEIHLMVSEPLKLGLACAHTGVERVIGHFEAFADKDHILPTLEEWRGGGTKEVGLAILFGTPFEALTPYIAACDFVLLMTIASIGVQGIPFEQGAPERIREFRAKYPNAVIAVDGGVSKSNIQDLVRAGATRFGVGSAISKAPDQKTAYEELKRLAEEAESKKS